MIPRTIINNIVLKSWFLRTNRIWYFSPVLQTNCLQHHQPTGSRFLCSSAALKSLSQTDSIPYISGKAGHYATNLYETAYDEGGGEKGLQEIELQLNRFVWNNRANGKQQDEWEYIVLNPLYTPEMKLEKAREFLQSLKATPIFINFILKLLEKREDHLLNQIRIDFEEIMRAHRREIDVELITPSSLSPEDLEYYKKTIKLNYLKPNDKMIFSHSVDNSIWKGYVVKVKGIRYDFTWNKQYTTEEENHAEDTAEHEVDAHIRDTLPVIKPPTGEAKALREKHGIPDIQAILNEIAAKYKNTGKPGEEKKATH